MTTTTIPLNKLLALDGNVRKTDSGKAISGLAASIKARRLLQSLVVRKDRFENKGFAHRHPKRRAQTLLKMICTSLKLRKLG